jgi:tRNA A-37 threonylcarbamoyl transferase component Bud32
MQIDRSKDLRWEPDILGITPHARMVVRYSFYRRNASSDSEPFLRFIGKFYADESAQTTYQIMQDLQKSFDLAKKRPPLTIPHPHFYDPDLRLIVQQHVEGIPYSNLLDHHDYPKYFRLVGRALAFLHAQDVPVGEIRSINSHLEDLIHPHPLRFCEELPQYRRLVEELIKKMGERERREKIEVSPIHRDFHLRQLFYGEERVWLIDWDLFAKGDPALDVGNFIVYLKTHLTKECMSVIDAFLEGYCSIGSSTILERLPIYEGLTFLRLACKRFRLKGDHWKEKVEDMLLQSEASFSEKSIFNKVLK